MRLIKNLLAIVAVVTTLSPLVVSATKKTTTIKITRVLSKTSSWVQDLFSWSKICRRVILKVLFSNVQKALSIKLNFRLAIAVPPYNFQKKPSNL